MAAPLGRRLVKFGSSLFRSNFTHRHPQVALYRANSTDENARVLTHGKGCSIAYRSVSGANPGIIFCPGFQSHMKGTKALALEKFCIEQGLAYTRFDYQGCGESMGDLRDVTLGDWKNDVLAVLDQLTAGPQIIVGSSLGALMMLHVAMERPHRIHSLVGVSSAADFPDTCDTKYPPKVYEALKTQTETTFENEFGNYLLTKKFIDEAKNHSIMKMDSIPIYCPIRLLHGMRDSLVPYDVALKLASKVKSNEVLVLLTKNGEHRFSQPDDIQLLFEELNYLIKGSDVARNLVMNSWSSFTEYSHPAHLLKPRLKR